jgi:hypothetical protein
MIIVAGRIGNRKCFKFAAKMLATICNMTNIYAAVRIFKAAKYSYFCPARFSAYSFRKNKTLAHKMYILLISIVLALFAAMVFLNVYFRVKVLKTYKILVQRRVEFGAAHLFNQQKMEQEIFPRYPESRKEIEIFVRHIRYSIRMATVLIALITLFGGILMYFRD